jgi:hypothetical protein
MPSKERLMHTANAAAPRAAIPAAPPAAMGQLSGDEMLVDLVSFKWLMAYRGCWIDLPRMRRDAAYADECLQRGLSAPSGVLRQRSRELQGALSGC